MKPLYLDNAATTRVYPGVIKSMLPYLKNEYGNPSSMHELGERAKKALNRARTELAKEINANPSEIIFTSGATESNNLAIQGLARRYPNKKTIIISQLEHPSVSQVCKFLQALNYTIIEIPVNEEGLIDLNILEKKIKENQKNILLVSIIHVNNIIGVVQDIHTIGGFCKKHSVLFHTDAVQSFGKLKIDVKKDNIDLLSASGHKIGAPKGIGFLYSKESVNLSPLVLGGGQERNLRSGTENLPSVVAFTKALEITKKINKNKILDIRNKIISELKNIGGIINGPLEKRIYNNIHVSFPPTDAEYLVVSLSRKGIYLSAGSACDSKKEKEDHVLKAIKVNSELTKSSIRITLNESINEKDIGRIVNEINKVVKILRV